VYVGRVPVTFLLSLAASGLGLAAPASDSRDLLQGLNSPLVSGWALSDFDGDSKVDRVTSGPRRADGPRYAYEVSVDLSAFPQSSFRFLTHSASVRLSAQDLDGDQDRDVVIFESASWEPIGVWLNDGSGNFSEGDVANFRDAFRHRAGRAFDSPEIGLKLPVAIPEQRIQSAILQASVIAPVRRSESLPPQFLPRGALLHLSEARPRAPPRPS
jgi:hypothetical protein